jgi:pimeloyl-ACP methyl ester carboxylesterase
MGHSMGGLALMQYTKLYASPELQKYIDRVVIIDIPATKLSTRPAQMKTGLMLRKMLEIDLNQPTTQVFHEIDRRALTPDIGALLKSDIVTVAPNEHRWRVNLKVLVDSYSHICDYELAKDNPKTWTVPVDVIYGENSGNFDDREKAVYQ